MRETTGQRAIEMRSILDDLDHQQGGGTAGGLTALIVF
jgi:hypothetical protein